ncbi:Uncharacterised protein [Chromobacterium violaceum]|uniref:Uncharacterized protein n=1 Tax=Chromobacterium violaceum TaxID=536 RepID=A0A3S4IGL9_CHRVL|nr:Uncharacterised protein [Chromobacterium violaceum]
MDVVARKIVFEAFNKVVLKSPVDTGAFRNSWTVGFGALPRRYHGADPIRH